MTYPVPDPGKGGLYGKQLEPRKIAELCYEAGWNDAQQLLVAVCVCLAESQGYDHAIHTNLDGSHDRGIWQLNSIHKGITDEIAYDPVLATAAAFSLYVSEGSDFGPWAAYTSEVYRHDTYVGRGSRGVGNYLAEVLLLDDTQYSPPILDYRHRVGNMKHHVTVSKQILGFGPKPKDIVLHTQEELSAALQAAIPVVPRP